MDEISDSKNNLLWAKVIAMVVLGVGSFILGVLPVKLSKMMNMKSSVNGGSDKNLLISLLLCFGGGVLLFTTFIHLQPEIRHNFHHLEEKQKIPSIGGGIPVSELVFILGFFFVYLIEEIAHSVVSSSRQSHDILQRSLSLRYRLTIPRVVLNHNSKLDDGQISYISSSNKELMETTHNDHHQHFSSTGGSVSGLFVVIALSFHAIFEGLAVGLESTMNNVWYLFAAITTHKLVIAFCVGVELVIANTRPLLIILYIGTFAVVTPFGIGAGIVLSKYENPETDLTSLILQGMAAGTLLYVVFFEVLAREKANRHSGIWQLVAILAGFTVMFALQVLTGHSHDHDKDHYDGNNTINTTVVDKLFS